MYWRSPHSSRSVSRLKFVDLSFEWIVRGAEGWDCGGLRKRACGTLTRGPYREIENKPVVLGQPNPSIALIIHEMGMGATALEADLPPHAD